ncbi:Oxysterol-binding protein-domain-containing protein [Boletus edulis BED1]|uniref:Oxysterol-binding protein-domain-containing protein n=1 Tax=Boletus edulis BED1 TaxID=1328754 RepID=A0AAD4BJ22_BOLED|nr:Oxysterol-binding protein-domain-containing protein [Boletus edulis BED1]
MSLHDSPSVLSVRTSGSVEPLQQVRLLSALRSGDPTLIHPFLTEIGKERRNSAGGDLNTGAAALHLAIRCASVETVQLLLSHRAISPNGTHPPGSGTTALHLAASLERVEIVSLLLDQPGIDDTLRDSQGRTCKDVAKRNETIKVLQDSRSFLSASYRSLLHSYALSPSNTQPSHALASLLESPRAKGIDLSYLDDTTGTSLLHEAARRKDLRLIELAVRAGADVFVRDRRGKMAYDGSGKDDRVRVFLRQFANHDQSLIDVPISEPPVLKGYLNKYANVAKGYNTRWFVLKDGVLSYYRHQEDEEIASRGAISMKTAILKIGTGNEKTRFEVCSAPGRGHTTGVQKWYMRANHPVEAARWTQAISKSMEWYRREADKSIGGRRSMESDRSVLRAAKIRTSFQSGVSAMRELGTHSLRGDQASLICTAEDDAVIVGDISKDSIHAPDEEEEEEAADRHDSSAASESTQSQPPHCSTFDLHGNSVAAQMDLTAHLLAGLPLPSDAPLRTQELREALKESFTAVQSMINEYVQMVKEREEWWKSQLQRERERQTIWEESLQTVVREGEALERELRARSRKRGSRFFDAGMQDAGSATVRQRPISLTASSSAVLSAQPSTYFTAMETPRVSLATIPTNDTPQSPVLLTPTQRRISRLTLPSCEPNETDDMHDTDEEDEFFDAIESGNLPNLVVSELLTSPTHSTTSLPLAINMEPFLGYKYLRTELSIEKDNRPSTSLWSVLKHSIGKDLTRITFPVFFNEPTSMLQRMAEDMEFSECLDVAVREQDPHRRIAFVAAFAMSNYSSTIGRIAKPFNPMLNETFEYVRLDKEYRYMSEQVSHHPPISACWAESPNWHYYGEVDAQNRFMGKSFEIRPTGVAHAELLLPEEWAPKYPIATTVGGKGKVVEHYSWKKVTTNVSGFILGSPTIDHYGDMIVTNHRTGDRCILTFKPRGWRGKDAYEISGSVSNSDGEITYEIAGRWNSQLICRAVGTGSGYLHPDAAVSCPASPNYMAEYILLWRNSEKPPTPFNLTPFAITLNDCPENTLKPFLCPTDCRLRPDQRAFEMGKYERANELKQRQEENQRATRRAREDGRLPPHRPRWFTAETDGDTGDRVWTPSRVDDVLEYWVERERVWKEGGNMPWKDVDPIFIENIP